MTKRESLYLDLLRAAASLIVLVGHAASIFDMPGVPLWGHHAVMLFFVLSGYVICHTADTRETAAQAFLVARFARLWSVLFPAILLTVICDVMGQNYGMLPGAYAHVPSDYPLIRVGAILSFTAESWVSIQPFSNGAVWSLCVEFWYYMLFAAWTFMPGGRRRAFVVAGLLLVSGHKAILLLPIWLMGVALQRSAWLRRLNPTINALLFAGGGFVAIGIMAGRLYDPAIDLSDRVLPHWIVHQLAEARVFWMDWLFGLLVTAHLLGSRTAIGFIPIERFARPIRASAGVSFAAYLFHMPLLQLCSAFLTADRGYLAVAVTMVAIAIVGRPVERTKRLWVAKLNALATIVRQLKPVAI